MRARSIGWVAAGWCLAAWQGTAAAECVDDAPDGVVDRSQGVREACDDGNARDWDGCTNQCLIETGFVCAHRGDFLTDAFELGVGTDDTRWEVREDRRVADVVGPSTGASLRAWSNDPTASTQSLLFRGGVADGYFGFVLGVDPPGSGDEVDWVLVDWKRVDESDGDLGTASAGLALSRVVGQPTVADLFSHTGTVSELARASDGLGDEGWEPGAQVRFDVEYAAERVVVRLGGASGGGPVVLAVDAPDGDPFPAGALAIYALRAPDTSAEVVAPLGPSSCTVPTTPTGPAGGGLCRVATSEGAAGAGAGTFLLSLIGVAGVAIRGRRRRARHRRGRLLILLVVLVIGACLVPSGRAAAQRVQLSQFRPAETAEDGFVLSRPNDLGHMRWGLQLFVDYASEPLVLEAEQGDASTQFREIVRHQTVAQAVFALGLVDRFVVFAGLPVVLGMNGDTIPGAAFPEADGPGLGDLWLGGRARLYGENDDPFGLAFQLTFTLPSARVNEDAQLTGEEGVTIVPELAAEARPHRMVRVTANLGARIRTTGPARFTNLEIPSELTYGIGATVALTEELAYATAALYGSTGFQDFGTREASPLELLIGFRWLPIPGLSVGLATGPGLSAGYGAPRVRVVGTIAYTDPAWRLRLPADADGDGIQDSSDDCPAEPETYDGFEDLDGCPDPDNDGDGLLDEADQCPLDAEDVDGFQDDDGCPDPDNDGDGLLDADDQCPLEAEDVDGFLDDDGCPDPDNDGDGLLDANDQCPLDPGTVDAGGCPQRVRVNRETGRILILEKVEFRTGSARLRPTSEPILEEVRAVLAANPRIRLVRVEGHTDDRGNDARNMRLSAERARSVSAWLIQHGIAAERLEALGCGELHPMEDNRAVAGRQANRRVEFHILDPSSGGSSDRTGCTVAREQ